MIRTCLLTAALLGFPGAAAIASAEEAGGKTAAAKPELPAWNPDEVAKLARELQQSADRLRKLERSAPQDSIASGQSRARKAYRDHLRALEKACGALAAQVEESKSREATQNRFGNVQRLGRDTAEEARRMFLSKETIDEIQNAEAQLNRLRVYYGGVPDPRPALVGPSKSEGGAEQKGE